MAYTPSSRDGREVLRTYQEEQRSKKEDAEQMFFFYYCTIWYPGKAPERGWYLASQLATFYRNWQLNGLQGSIIVYQEIYCKEKPK